MKKNEIFDILRMIICITGIVVVLAMLPTESTHSLKIPRKKKAKIEIPKEQEEEAPTRITVDFTGATDTNDFAISDDTLNIAFRSEGIDTASLDPARFFSNERIEYFVECLATMYFLDDISQRDMLIVHEYIEYYALPNKTQEYSAFRKGHIIKKHSFQNVKSIREAIEKTLWHKKYKGEINDESIDIINDAIYKVHKKNMNK